MNRKNFFWFAGLAGLFLALTLLLGGCQAERDPRPADPEQAGSTEPHHLTIEEAEAVALRFLSESETPMTTLRSVADEGLELAFAEPASMIGLRAVSDDETADDRSSLPAYYVFNIGRSGYVIVSAWDNTFPILGFSYEGSFFGKDVAETRSSSEVKNVMSFLSSYASGIDSLRRVLPVTPELRKHYESALRGDVAGQSLRASGNIEPLLGDIKWNQSPYYNAYCPTGTPVGCVATATSQIMRYWKYPPRGTGSHTSTTDGQYANFNKHYNWDNMPAATLRQYNDDVAQLCYDVAVGLNMQFSAYGSGTWQYYVPSLLADHFFYKNTVRDIYRSNYNASDWASIVYNELANGRPVQYAGSGRTGAGHSFVCDGYMNGYFHINWGWGGMSDGYFLLHALDPSSLGTGGGNGGFNYGQDIVIGIEPAQRPDPKPTPDSGSITYLTLDQLRRMLSFGQSGRVSFGSGYSGPMVLFLKAAGCGHCEHTRPAVELLAKEYGDRIPFYGFDVVTNGQWGANWDYIRGALGIETVPQLLFITKEGTYTLKNGVIETSVPSEGAAIFRPYVERLINDRGDDPVPSGDYCPSTARYAHTTYIARVGISNVDNVTSSDAGGYSYFDRRRVELTPGETYRVTLMPGSVSGSYPEYWRVWIDLNGDKGFDSDEMALDFTTTQSNVPVVKTITIPSSARRGNTRMRVSMKWGSAPEACETFDHGEVEDYPVLIKDKVTPKPDPEPEPEPVPEPDPKPEPKPDPTPDPEPDPEPENDPYPVSYAKDSDYAYISEVKIGDMSNSGTGGDGYTYYPKQMIIGNPGRALSFQLSPSFASAQLYWCYWRIWIDYNKDGQFSSTELVASRYGNRDVSGWFTLPYRMDPGLYRVRVSMKVKGGYPQPDEIFDYGEVEDYRLRIQ